MASEEAGVVGVVIGVPGAEWRWRRVWTALVMLGAGLDRARALARSGGLVDRLTPPVPDDCWYVASLAVARDARRRGVGSALMAAIETEARGHGAVRLALDVNRTNVGGRAFYARLGFLEAAATAGQRRPGTPGFLRLEKPVRPAAVAA